MELIPALDIRGGRVVRLLKGDFARETAYSDDPGERARAYAAASARRLHVVDLDAAAGRGDNRVAVAAIVESAGVDVQVAGGVRTPQAAEAWLALGAAAVVLGTAAVREPAMLRGVASAHPGRVAAALDVRGGRPAVTGWTAVEEHSVEDVLAAWEEAPLAAVILTAIDRDGTLAGPDLAALAAVRARTRHPVLYSGGIASLEDLDALAAAGAVAAILGKALLEGRFTLQEAIARCAVS